MKNRVLRNMFYGVGCFSLATLSLMASPRALGAAIPDSITCGLGSTNAEGQVEPIRDARGLEVKIFFDRANRVVNVSGRVAGTRDGIRTFEFTKQHPETLFPRAIGHHFGLRYMLEIQRKSIRSIPDTIESGDVVRIGDAFGYGERADEPVVFGKSADLTLVDCR